MFAIDNGAYGGLQIDRFEALLKREMPRRKKCIFVTVPDIVANARRTSELFEFWYPKLQSTWPLAYVAQDGIEDLPIPWKGISAIFIGGSTAWKMSDEAIAVIKTAKALKKWVHIGRVNTPGRFEHFESLGADSIDGTGLAQYTWMRKAIYEAATAPRLFPKIESVA